LKTDVLVCLAALVALEGWQGREATAPCAFAFAPICPRRNVGFGKVPYGRP